MRDVNPKVTGDVNSQHIQKYHGKGIGYASAYLHLLHNGSFSTAHIYREFETFSFSFVESDFFQWAGKRETYDFSSIREKSFVPALC